MGGQSMVRGPEVVLTKLDDLQTRPFNRSGIHMHSIQRYCSHMQVKEWNLSDDYYVMQVLGM
jgi:hypothetical protein